MWPSMDDRDDEHVVARTETGAAVLSTPVHEPDEAAPGAADELIEGLINDPALENR